MRQPVMCIIYNHLTLDLRISRPMLLLNPGLNEQGHATMNMSGIYSAENTLCLCLCGNDS